MEAGVKQTLWQYFGRQRPVLRSFRDGIGKTSLLLPTTFIVVVAIGTVNLGLIFYMKDDYGFSAALVGAFAAVFSLSYFTGCIILRPLSIKLLPRHCIIISTFTMGSMVLLIVFTQTPWIAFLCYGFYGLLLAFFFPPLVGWLSIGVEGKELNRTISRWNLSWSSGTIVSPFLAGYLTEQDLLLPLFTGAGLMFIGGAIVVLASLFLPAIRQDTHKEKRPTLEDRSRDDKSTFLRFPSWIAMMTLYSVLGVVFNIFPLYAREGVGMTESTIGLVLLTRAFFTTGAFVLLGRMSWWHFNAKQILVTQVLFLLIVVLMIPLDSFLGYLLIMPFLGVMVSMSYSNSIFHGVSGSIERGKRMAIHEAILTIGVVSGSLLGGQLYQQYSMKEVYLFCIAMIFTGLIVQMVMILFFYKPKRKISGRKSGATVQRGG